MGFHPYYHMLRCPWNYPEVYDRAVEWIRIEGKRLGICLEDASYGISYINNKTYYARVSFSTESDIIIFKIRFPEIT